jgi:ABC-type lipoprotein export system ATPase subunit
MAGLFCSNNYLLTCAMTIKLDQLIPRPLRDRLSARPSDIWNTTVSLKSGDIVKIKAPSGSGKTTLVHIIYKLRQDYDGAVYLDNKALPGMAENELATVRQVQMAIVFQDLRLFPNLSARENIELKRILQAPFYEAGKIDEMAQRLGVTHVLDQQAGICSYGEQQRIAIIRALIQPYSWLVMDEPFSHLDQANTRLAADLIAEECKKRGAGLLVTDLDEDSNFDYTQQYQL